MCAFQQRATHLRPIADDERAAPSGGGGQFLGPVHEGFVIKNINDALRSATAASSMNSEITISAMSYSRPARLPGKKRSSHLIFYII